MGLNLFSNKVALKQKRLVAILEIIRVEEFVPRSSTGYRGHPEEDRRAIARAFIAKMVYNLPLTKQLIEPLKNAPKLRRSCGWDRRSAVPCESTFSRAFAESNMPARVPAVLIEKQ